MYRSETAKSKGRSNPADNINTTINSLKKTRNDLLTQLQTEQVKNQNPALQTPNKQKESCDKYKDLSK